MKRVNPLFFLIASIFFYSLYSIRFHEPISDEALLILDAMRILNGMLPYRDFFELVTPGTMYLGALAISACGSNLWAIKGMAVISGSLIVFFTAMISSRVIKKPIFFLIPPALTMLFGFSYYPYYSHHWYSTLFALMTTWLLLDSEEESTKAIATRNLFLAGIFSALTFLFLQHKGVYLFMSVLSFMILKPILFLKGQKEAFSEILYYILGFFPPIALFVLHLLITGSLKDFIYDGFVWLFEGYLPFNRYASYYFLGETLIGRLFEKYHFLTALLHARHWIVFGYLPLLIYLITPIYLFLRRRGGASSDRNTILLFVTGLGVFLTTILRSDPLHMFFIFPWVWIILVILLEDAYSHDRKAIKLIAGLAIFFIYLEIFYRPHQEIRESFSHRYRVESPRGAYFFKTEEDASEFREILNFIKGIPEKDELFVYHWKASLYYAAGRKNPTKYDGILPLYNTESQFNNIISDINKKRIKYIIHDGLCDHIRGYALQGFLPPEERNRLVEIIDSKDPLEKFVEKNYSVLKRVGRYTIYVRKAPPSPMGRI